MNHLIPKHSTRKWHQSQLNKVSTTISQTTKQKHNARAETEHKSQNEMIAKISKRKAVLR
jgi:hypothetical protein